MEDEHHVKKMSYEDIQTWAKDNTNTGKIVPWWLQFKTAALLQRVIWHSPATELEVFEVYFK